MIYDIMEVDSPSEIIKGIDKYDCASHNKLPSLRCRGKGAIRVKDRHVKDMEAVSVRNLAASERAYAQAREIAQADIDASIAQARSEARAEIAEMRKSWDRVAQDVFSAFVTRLVAEQATGADGGWRP